MYIIHLQEIRQNTKCIRKFHSIKRKFKVESPISHLHTCECILDMSSACCSKLGNMILSAGLFEQTMVQCGELTGVFGAAAFRPFASLPALVIVPGNNCKFDDDIDCNDCRSDVEMKPGGVGSTFSAISMARCKCAFLSQSSIEYSSDANLSHRIENIKWMNGTEQNERTNDRTNGMKKRKKNEKRFVFDKIRFSVEIQLNCTMINRNHDEKKVEKERRIQKKRSIDDLPWLLLIRCNNDNISATCTEQSSWLLCWNGCGSDCCRIACNDIRISIGIVRIVDRCWICRRRWWRSCAWYL